jgi:hypothetical protein
MSAGIIWAWIVANQTSVTTILLIISELLGASSKVKANGILSFILLQVQEQLKKRGAKDPTP